MVTWSVAIPPETVAKLLYNLIHQKKKSEIAPQTFGSVSLYRVSVTVTLAPPLQSDGNSNAEPLKHEGPAEI